MDILEPWPWYLAGPLITLVMFLLIFLGRKFGMSSNLRTVCAIAGGGKASSYFNFDWKKDLWNLVVVLGAIVGGFVANNYLSHDQTVDIAASSVEQLEQLNFRQPGSNYLPEEIFRLKGENGTRNIFLLIFGGILVGFGARYAGGCTSGHAISGLSNLQWPSLVAVIGFFIGGLIMVHLLFPIIF